MSLGSKDDDEECALWLPAYMVIDMGCTVWYSVLTSRGGGGAENGKGC